MNDLIQLNFMQPAADWGGALIRVFGGVFVASHGFRKARGGIKDFIPWLESLNVPAPKLAAWCAMLAELVGGLFMAAGLITRPAALAVVSAMLVAVLLAHLGDARNFGKPEGVPFEYPMLLFAIATGTVLTGGGKLSLDALVAGR